MSCRISTEFKKEATQWLSFYLKNPHQATEAMHWMNLPQLPGAVGGAGARGGHLERSDLTDAGGCSPDGGPKAGKQCFNKAKLIPVAAIARETTFALL